MRDGYDVAVVGAGVIGTAIAARLSQTESRVILLESGQDIAEGASKGNLGVASAYYGPPGFGARMLKESNPQFDDLCRRLDVPFGRIGGLTVAVGDFQDSKIRQMFEEATSCGVTAEVLTGKQARAMEPQVTEACTSALFLPDDCIIDPMRLTLGYAELAAANGADILLGAPVIGLEKTGSNLTCVVTPRRRIPVRYVVNAAGLHADSVSALAGGEAFKMWPRKGQFWLLDREFGERMRYLVFSAPPSDETKGSHVAITTSGSVLLGPSAEDQVSRIDRDTDREVLDRVFRDAQKIVPSVSREFIVKSFSGLRPASAETFFVRRDARVENLIHAVCRSSGMSASPAIGDLVVAILRGERLAVRERADAVHNLPSCHRFRTEQGIDLGLIDPRYRQVVCVCEQVTAAEIAAALSAHIPARSIEGVRKRTGATGGRCQGGLCMAGVLLMLSQETGMSPGEILNEGGRSGEWAPTM